MMAESDILLGADMRSISVPAAPVKAAASPQTAS
jgi:hypothetical protein